MSVNVNNELSKFKDSDLFDNYDEILILRKKYFKRIKDIKSYKRIRRIKSKRKRKAIYKLKNKIIQYG